MLLVMGRTLMYLFAVEGSRAALANLSRATEPFESSGKWPDVATSPSTGPFWKDLRRSQRRATRSMPNNGLRAPQRCGLQASQRSAKPMLKAAAKVAMEAWRDRL